MTAAPIRDTREDVDQAARQMRDHRWMRIHDMLRRLVEQRDAAEADRDGANQLIERMHTQDVLAIKAWQKAHPGNDLVWPDQMRLTAWCMGSVARLVVERDDYRAICTDALAENDALRFERNNLCAALTTARADALGEAIATVDSTPTTDQRAAREVMQRLQNLIKELPHA